MLLPSLFLDTGNNKRLQSTRSARRTSSCTFLVNRYSNYYPFFKFWLRLRNMVYKIQCMRMSIIPSLWDDNYRHAVSNTIPVGEENDRHSHNFGSRSICDCLCIRTLLNRDSTSKRPCPLPLTWSWSWSSGS
jgi:hypothetical protein